MIVVTVDPELARKRYGLAGELAARAAGHVIQRGMGSLGNAPSSSTKTAGDVILVATILGAIGALVWWSKGQKRLRNGR